MIGPGPAQSGLQHEIATMRRELLAARERLADHERLAELGTLTGGLAHEIKNPLSTVQLNLQLLGEDVSLDWPGAPRVLSRLKIVQGEIKRVRETLDDFLRYAGKLELELGPVDLQSLVEDLADFFEPQAQLARVRLRVRPAVVRQGVNAEPAAAGRVTVAADGRLLKQTVLNLMLNAVQAMPNGGELILSADILEGADGPMGAPMGVLHVIDTGSGIAPEQLPKIFNAYYSTKPGGTGLGLAMSRRIVREHRGELTVRSELGKGSEFIVTLPLASWSAEGGTPAVH